MAEINFVKLAEWQPLDCLYCGSEATLQAEAKKGDVSTALRCCSKEECKALATSEANESLKVLCP